MSNDGVFLWCVAKRRIFQDLFLVSVARNSGRGVDWIGFIRAVKGVIIGQLLISIVRFGALFELYSANFLMKHFWAVLLVLFALAFIIAGFLAYLERRVAYYAARR